MDLDVLRSRWREQQVTLADQRFDELLANIRSRTQQFESTILWRDRIETGAAICVIVFFLVGLWIIPMPPAMAVGIVICIGAALLIIWTLRWMRLRDPQPAPDAPLLEFASMSLARLDRQIYMLRRVFWWYILPCSIGEILVLGGGTWIVREVPAALAFTGILLCVVLFGLIVYRSNMNALTNDLLPRRQELAELLQLLTESGDGTSLHNGQDDPEPEAGWD